MADNFNAYDQLRNSGQKLVGIIESIGYGEKDKKKQDGRVLVRLVQQEGSSYVPTDQLSWVKVSQPATQGSIRGVGATPGHRLTPGTKVELEFSSQQILQVTNVINNDDEQEDKSDLHPYKKEKKDHVDPNKEAFEQEFAIWNGSPLKMNADQARRVNTSPATPKKKKDPVKAVTNEAENPKRLGGGKGVKSQKEKSPETLGGYAREVGDLLNATKAIKQLLGKKGEIIPNALKMMESLQQQAKAGSIVNSTSMVGGMGNITGAIMGILQLAKNKKKNTPKKKEDDELDLLELLLRQLYRELTNQEPLDDKGEETLEYKNWKVEYLKALELEQETDVPVGVTS